MGLRALIALLICCTVTLGDDSWTPVAIDVWDSNCDESQVQVASPYTCDEANPNDVTLSYAATDTWHDGGGRSFWVSHVSFTLIKLTGHRVEVSPFTKVLLFALNQSSGLAEFSKSSAN